jgi:hypothetical protein
METKSTTEFENKLLADLLDKAFYGAKTNTNAATIEAQKDTIPTSCSMVADVLRTRSECLDNSSKTKR